jgi:hypothetical protein
LIWNLIGLAKDTGGREVAEEIFNRFGKTNLLLDDVRARLAAMVQSQ